MLRISRTSVGGRIMLKLDGEISGRWVEELRAACRGALGVELPSDRALVVDVADVSWIDAAGLALVQDLAERGVTLTNASPYLAELLNGAADSNR